MTRDRRQQGYAIEVLLERGLERYRTGLTSVALQLWDEALAIDPDEPRALTYIDYVRQNWDEVDGCVDPPVPDVSGLVPNYLLEPEPEQAPVAGEVSSPAPVAAAPVAAVPDAVPDPIHDMPTPRGTVEFQVGGVGGDGWGLAAEPLLRGALAVERSRPWAVAAAAAVAESPADPATVVPLDILPASLTEPGGEAWPVEAAPEEAAPAETVPVDESEILDEALELPAVPPAEPVAAAGEAAVEPFVAAAPPEAAVEPFVAPEAAVEPFVAAPFAAAPEAAAVEPFVAPEAAVEPFVAAPFAAAPEAAAVEPVVAEPFATAPEAAVAEPVAEAFAPAPLPAAPLAFAPFAGETVVASLPPMPPPTADDLGGTALSTESSTSGDLWGDDAFGDDDRPTRWLPPPVLPGLTLAERVEQAMAREADPFGEDRITTSWQAPPAELLARARAAGEPDATAAVASVAVAEPAPAVESVPAVELAAVELAAVEVPVEAADPVEPPTTELPAVERPAVGAAPAVELPAVEPSAVELPAVEPVATDLAAMTADGGAIALVPSHEEEAELARLDGPAAALEPEGSVFDRITTLLPTEPEDEARVSLPLPPRTTLPMAAARVTVPMATAVSPGGEDTAPADGYDFGDLELAPRSGVGLGAAPPAAPPLVVSTDTGLPPRERRISKPPPIPRQAIVRFRADPDEMDVDDGDILGDDGEADSELPTSPPAASVPPVPLTEIAEASFDGPEARTVTIVPPVDDVELAAPTGPALARDPEGVAVAATRTPVFGVGLTVSAPEGEDPFELPTAPITPIVEADLAAAPPAAPLSPTAELEDHVPALAARLARAAAEHDEPTVAGSSRAKTLELVPASGAGSWGATTADPTHPYQADTADLMPRIPAPPADVAAPVPLTVQPVSRDLIDTVDLGGRSPGWSEDADPMAGRRLRSAPAWAPPPPADTARPAEPPEGRHDPADPRWARDPGADRLGARLSPAVLLGLGLTPIQDAASPEEATRDGWPRTWRGRPEAEPLASEVAADPGVPATSAVDQVAMHDLDLPPSRATLGARTPGEVLLRSSTPEALSAALAAELDRSAPAGESSDDRARRRISALLERASAAARAGEHPMSIAAIDLALSEAPDSAVAQKLIHRSRDIILDCYTRYFGDLTRRPVPVGSLSELTGRPLDPRAAFLVSRMDGTLSYEEILDVAGMGRLEACRHLAQLLVRGIIRAT